MKKISLLMFMALTMAGCPSASEVSYLLDSTYSFDASHELVVLHENGTPVENHNDFVNAYQDFYGPANIQSFKLKSPSVIDLMAAVNSAGDVVIMMENPDLRTRIIGEYIHAVTYSNTDFNSFDEISTSARVNIKIEPSLMSVNINELTAKLSIARQISNMFLYYQQLFIYTDNGEIGLEPESVNTTCDLVLDSDGQAQGVSCLVTPTYQFGGNIVDCHYGNWNFGC